MAYDVDCRRRIDVAIEAKSSVYQTSEHFGKTARLSKNSFQKSQFVVEKAMSLLVMVSLCS